MKKYKTGLDTSPLIGIRSARLFYNLTGFAKTLVRWVFIFNAPHKTKL